MYEVILTVCVFANAYSTDLNCQYQKLDELPSCGAVAIDEDRWDKELYHPTRNPRGEIFIKGVECRKMVPVAPPETEGQKSA